MNATCAPIFLCAIEAVVPRSQIMEVTPRLDGLLSKLNFCDESYIIKTQYDDDVKTEFLFLQGKSCNTELVVL